VFRVHLDICEAREELTLDLNELAGASEDARRERSDIAMDALEEQDNETLKTGDLRVYVLFTCNTPREDHEDITRQYPVLDQKFCGSVLSKARYRSAASP
jgi:hypothetical protein